MIAFNKCNHSINAINMQQRQNIKLTRLTILKTALFSVATGNKSMYGDKAY